MGHRLQSYYRGNCKKPVTPNVYKWELSICWNHIELLIFLLFKALKIIFELMNDSIKELVNENAFLISVLLVFKCIATNQIPELGFK